MSTSFVCVLGASDESNLEREPEAIAPEGSSRPCTPGTEPTCKEEKPAPQLSPEPIPRQSDQVSRVDGPPMESGGGGGGARGAQQGDSGLVVGRPEDAKQLGKDNEVLTSHTTTLNSGSGTQSDLRQKESQIPATSPSQTQQDSLKETGGHAEHENTEDNRHISAGQDHPSNNVVAREDAPATNTDQAGRPQETQNGLHPNSSTEPSTSGTNAQEESTQQEQTSDTQDSQSKNGTDEAARTTSDTPINNNNEESPSSTTTTTTTTTTTLPPELTNNKKSDADSSSSISSVWMRTAAPLLIVTVLFSASVY
ncbi:uncharacterized protein TM35_000981110 [Trypanosoma theileri]|uniref:Uncharacterized protein n=1 Tax=Trypanosoma theileri TaxID=67003 RepID=A0A1X0NEE2_9TRYP|nr:uncharacterized protein TM35_000981110 [Trypanosoma theileri]ORC82108.1 hypothetical protein TM35_000981110 [Trypanosoma theileri]